MRTSSQSMQELPRGSKTPRIICYLLSNRCLLAEKLGRSRRLESGTMWRMNTTSFTRPFHKYRPIQSGLYHKWEQFLSPSVRYLSGFTKLISDVIKNINFLGLVYFWLYMSP